MVVCMHLCSQYDSGTGWPSFYAPVDPEHIIERVDPHDQATLPKMLWRTEVLDRKSGTHLGHVFPGISTYIVSVYVYCHLLL
jgi:peptide methionine sulfoxide reductase MsrB